MNRLLLLFGFATVVSAANAEERQSACRSISTDADRLACFDREFRPITARTSAWAVTNSQSKLDRSEGVTASVKARAARKSSAPYEVKATLVISCIERATSAYVLFQDWQGGREIVGTRSLEADYRIGDAGVRRAKWTVSDDSSAFGPFYSKESVEFAKALKGATELFIRARSHIGVSEAEFDITGIDDAITGVRTSCKW